MAWPNPLFSVILADFTLKSAKMAPFRAKHWGFEHFLARKVIKTAKIPRHSGAISTISGQTGGARFWGRFSVLAIFVHIQGARKVHITKRILFHPIWGLARNWWQGSGFRTQISSPGQKSVTPGVEK